MKRLSILVGCLILFNACTPSSTTIDAKFDPGVDADPPVAIYTLLPAVGYGIGSNISATVTFNEDVYVTGNPRLQLTLDSGSVWADLVSSRASRTLTFQYDVTVGDTDLTGLQVSDKIDLTNGRIYDKNENEFEGEIAAPSVSSPIYVDTVPPTLLSVSPAPEGHFGVGANVDFVANFSENVYVSSGTPNITVEVGGITTTARYVSGSGTPNLTFRYTVSSGHLDTDGVVLQSPIVLNGGSILDVGRNPNSTLAFTPPNMPNVRIDGIAPTLASITGPPSGTYSTTDVLNFRATFTKPVYVSGSPKLPISIGSGTVYAIVSSGSGTNTLTFQYTVVNGDFNSNGLTLPGTFLLSPGNTIRDYASNELVNTFTATTFPAVVIDASSPSIISAAAPSTGIYKLNQNLDIDLQFSEPVNVVGTPRIRITLDSGVVYANYLMGTGSTTLRFRKTVASGDLDVNGIAINGTVEQVAGSTIKDLTGNNAILTFTSASTVGVRVDGVAPAVSSVTLPGAGTYKVGDILSFVVTFDDTIAVSGSPRLVLDVGGATRYATYSSVSGSALTFRYTVNSGDVDTDGISLNTTIATNGGSIKDASLNDALLTMPSQNTSSIKVDGLRPTIVSISSAVANGTYTHNDMIDVTVTFSENVTILGLPRIVLNTGASVNLTSSTATTATFNYIVGASDVTNRLNVSSVLTGISITDLTGNTADLALPTGSNLADNKAIVINGRPVASNITPTSFNEDTQSIITLSYTDPENDQATSCTLSSLSHVTVTPACACSGGVCTVGVTGTSNYNGAASFSYTVSAGGLTSNSATATLSILPVDDSPIAVSITPAAFNEDTQSIITLSYTDPENDQATSCAISGLNNVTITQSCGCASGVCSVGVTGTSNYNGSGSFTYTVTANGKTSSAATASLTITAVDDAPVAANITPASFNEDTQSIITLSYTDSESDQATTCSLSSLSHVTVTQACGCTAGTCTVGVTGTANYNGVAGFNYTVTANGKISSSAAASLTITSVDDAPVAANITPAAFNEDTQSIITLSYTDAESDPATSCSLSGLSNVTVTQACGCASGVCTVGVTGSTNYNGSASFSYTVTANGQPSNSATATLSVTAVDDAPVASNITPAAFNEDTQSIITLSYTDTESNPAASCSTASLTNITVTQACACSAGTCTVGVTGTSNYNGSASFTYTVTAGGQSSNSATASLTINAVDDSPVANNITPAAFNEDVQSIITLSYSDAESDQATNCAIAGLSHVNVTQACGCAAGTCTVGVTGTSNYNGTASFTYTVTANSKTSGSATATLTINPVDDAPVASPIFPASFPKNTESLVTLSYTDVDGDVAGTCTLSNLSGITETTACSCDGMGICRVGVTGTFNYSGSASFEYTVTANSVASNSALASLTITNTNTAPVANNITPAAFNEDTQSIITLSYSDIDGDAATACTISTLSNVTVTQACGCAAGICTVGVTGTSNFNGSASFAYTVTANGQTSNSASATLSISAVDDSPVANNITPASFNEDTQSIITLSYSDIESDQAVSCTTSNLANITVTQACACSSGTCTVGVTGTTNYNGSAGFDYTVTANGKTSNAASVTLTITAVNDAPVASNITPAAFNEDTQSIITLSYTDADADQASACTTSSLSNVTVTQACSCTAGTCTVGVTGTSNYNGVAGFSYTVTANGQTSNTATASLSITAVDDAPVASNISPAAFNEDTQSIITLSYSDAESDQATICSTSSLTNVTVNQACACAAGVCTVGVTGTSNYNGSASFAYSVTANGQASNSATVSLSITAVDDAPVASNITPAAFNEDIQSIITLNYTDAESDQATVCSTSNLSNVTVTQACSCSVGTCTVGVTGTSNYNGSASFDYTVSANGKTSNSASASLTITAVNDAPVASNITPAAFNEDTQSLITLSYTDAESDQATVCTTSSLTNVNVTQACSCAAGVCTVGVTGTSNYNGAASFAYTVTANGQVSNSASATLSIIAVDDAPVASNITPAAFNEDTQSIITLSYSDVESDQATVCSTSSLSNVTVTQACACSSGTCTVGVTGTSNYNGSASFAYTVTANGQTSNSATASLTISAVDDAPVANNLLPTSFNEDTQSIITLSYSDTEGNFATSCTLSNLTNITVTQACSCTLGTCSVGVTGTTNYFGMASFDYTVTANGLTSNTAAASLNIDPVDDAPVAANITPAAFNEDTQSVITLSYTDVESNQATACSISSPSNVTVTQACACSFGTCTVGVTGTANFNGSASFAYTVTANGLSSNSATASLTISPVADAPVAANITPAAFNEDTQSIITLSYTDAESDQAVSCSTSSLANVTVTQACACSSGTCTVGVTGTSNDNGSASFAYTVTANGQTSNSATATLSITAVDDAPVASNITPSSFNEDTQSIITLSYTDAESDQAVSCSTSSLSNVTVTQACACSSGTCTVGVTGTSNYNGSASFAYTVTANGQSSNSATATLSITAVDDAPVASNITPAAFNEDTQSIITLSYTDAESDQAVSCSTSSLTNVTVTQACACSSGTCTVGVTGTANYNGSASFACTVTANSKTSNSATATLSITAVDDAPVANNITPSALTQGVQSIITLSYTDVESNLASSCAISSLVNASVTQICSCSSGTCTVGITSSSAGAGSFNYTVTANGLTSNAATATLTVNSSVSAPTISYASSTGTTGTVGLSMSVTPSTLNNNGGTITSCTSSPALPAGLAIDSSTCVISGSPTAAQASTSYTITATNSAGSSTASVSLTIVQPSIAFTIGNSYDFGDVTINSSGEVTLTISNLTASALTLTPVALSEPFRYKGSSGAAGSFPGTGGTCSSAAGGFAASADCTIVVQFSPTTIASFSQTLTITYTGGAALNLALTGNGISDVATTPVPVIQTADNQTNTATSSTPTVNKPTNLTAGDLILVIYHVNSGAVSVSADPSGFTALRNDVTGSAAADARNLVYYRVATGTEGATFSITLSGSALWRATALRITGASKINPIDKVTAANTEQTAGTTLVLPTLNTATASQLLVASVINKTTTAITAAASFTQVTASNTTFSSYIGRENLSVVGAAGTRSFTTGSGLSTGMMISIRPNITDDVPGAPTIPALGLTAANTVQFTWTRPASKGEVDYFRVERAPDSSGTPGTYTWLGDVTTNVYSDTSVSAGVKYWYRVKASNANGDSAYTSAVSITNTATAPIMQLSQYKTLSGTTQTVEVPRPDNLQSGDLVILTLSIKGTAAVTVQNPGFAQINDSGASNASSGGRVVAYWMKANGSDPLNYTMKIASAVAWKLTAVRVTGQHGTTPIGPTSILNQANATSIVLATITTTEANNLLVGNVGVAAGVTSPVIAAGMTSAWSLITQPSSITATEIRASAGATGTRTFSWSGNSRNGGLMYSIRPY